MFEQRPDNKRALEAAANAMSQRARGDILTHDEIGKLIGSSPPEPRYYSLVQRLRKQMLADHGVWLESVPLVGYRLALPKEQVHAARDQQVRGSRRVRRGLSIVTSLPLAECDAEVQKAKFGIEESLAFQEREMRKQSQLMAFLLRPRECLPRVIEDT